MNDEHLSELTGIYVLKMNSWHDNINKKHVVGWEFVIYAVCCNIAQEICLFFILFQKTLEQDAKGERA